MYRYKLGIMVYWHCKFPDFIQYLKTKKVDFSFAILFTYFDVYID